MVKQSKLPACGNPNCGASSDINETITFGSGKLDDYGYWEFPCYICARAFEKLHPEYTPCWPFKNSKNEKSRVRLLDWLDNLFADICLNYPSCGKCKYFNALKICCGLHDKMDYIFYNLVKGD